MNEDRLLNGVLKLGDLDDVERFAHAQARKYLSKFSIPIRPGSVDYDELVTHVISLTWELFDSKFSGNGSFGGYASSVIGYRITDYFREKYGRTAQSRLDIEVLVDDPLRSTVGSAVAYQSAHAEADSTIDLRGVLLSRDR